MESRFLTTLRQRPVVADGAMGTMLQAAELTLDDFEGLEGCNEILNITRPDVVRGIHDAYFAVGCDAVETNTFGANFANLAEYGIADRITELAEAGARLAREVADGYSTPDRPRWVIGSVGPGTKLPTLGHAPYATLRDAYQQEVAGLLAGGADVVLVETSQDLLQTKSAIIGARRAMTAAGLQVPLIAQVTVETTGTMLLGSEIGAALTALEPLGIDLIGLNCATGPTEMSEHLRFLSRHARIPLSVMPNAGLPELGPTGATYPLTPDELAAALSAFVREYGTRLVGGCCGTTPEHLRQVVEAVREVEPVRRKVRTEAAASSLYQSVPFRQDAGVLMIGERTNANGSKAFREAMLEGRWDDCVAIARSQIRDGSHMLDVCIDYVGRDGTGDMREIAGRFATASTLPLMLDSTEPPVIEAGLEMLGGRCVVNSVNYEDGDGPDSRFARAMPIIKEHGAAVVVMCIDEEGQARTADWKVRVADRHDPRPGREVGHAGRGHHRRLPDLPDRHRAGGDPARRHRDHRGDPRAQAALPAGADHAGRLQRLVRAQPGRPPGAQLGLPARVRQRRARLGDRARVEDPADVQDRGRAARGRARHGLRPPPRGLRPAAAVPGSCSRASAPPRRGSRGPRSWPRCRCPSGWSGGSSTASATGWRPTSTRRCETRPPLEIINDTLLAGMKTVGDLFGSGEMQLPFVLQSAEVMKTAVAHLEPHMEKSGAGGKGRIVLATVKGDVHDIGKNLVDIILSNNGYTVVNLGIKQPISAILDAAEQHEADVIGMSGLLVKSTVVMKENLEEMNQRGVAEKYPVLLGGAALTRAYVEHDLSEVYAGDVRYARDAFEGLRLMDALMAARRGSVPAAATPDGAAEPNLAGAVGTAEEDRKRAERKARRERSLRIAAQRRAAEEAEEATPPGRARTWPPTTRCRRRRSGAAGWSRASSSPTTPRCWTSGRPSSASGGCAAPAAARARRTRSWWRPRAGRGCATGWTGSRPRASSRPPSSTATSRPSARATTCSCSATTAPSGSGSPSRGSAGTGGCAWPTSSARRTPARPTWSPSRWSRWASGSASSPPSCSRPTPTATTWRCTGCRCS